MKKIIFILLIPFFFLFIAEAQVNYFREKGTSITFSGGFANAESNVSYSATMAIAINSLEFGMEYGVMPVSFVEDFITHTENLSIFSPYIERNLFRSRNFGLSMGVSYLLSFDIVAPYMNCVFDLSQNEYGLTILPDLTLAIPVKLYNLTSSYEAQPIAGIGLMFINRKEKGASLFFRPGIAKGFNSGPVSVSLSAGSVFRR